MRKKFVGIAASAAAMLLLPPPSASWVWCPLLLLLLPSTITGVPPVADAAASPSTATAASANRAELRRRKRRSPTVPHATAAASLSSRATAPRRRRGARMGGSLDSEHNGCDGGVGDVGPFPSGCAVAAAAEGGRIARDAAASVRGSVFFRGGEVEGSGSWRRHLTLALVATALFNDMLQLTMLLPILPSLVNEPPPLGVDPSRAQVATGLFFAAKDICQLAFAPLAGILTSKTSSSAALLLSTAGLGVATLVFAEATTFRGLVAARGLQGAASAAMLCGGLSLVAETYPAAPPSASAGGKAEGGHRGRAMGIAYTGLALGLLLGPLIGGLLFDRVGRRDTFRIAGFAVLVNAAAQVVLMFFARPTHSFETNGGNAEPIKKGSSSSTSTATSFYTLLRDRDVLTITASNIAIHAAVGAIKPLSQIVLDREFGLSTLERSAVITIATAAYFVATPLAGWVSDRAARRSSLVAASLVLMAASAGAFAARVRFGMNAFYACVALLGVSMGFNGAVGGALLADLVDRGAVGRGEGGYGLAFALSDVADSAGLIMGSVLGLTASQKFGPGVGVGILGVFCLSLVPRVMRIEG